jgi:Tripartite tricarboxylate transporter family receptor
LVFYEHNNQALGRIACRPQSNDTRAPLAGNAVDPLVQGLSVFDLSDFSRLHTDKADAQHLWLLLRARRERPRDRRAAENGDELAPFHSITSLAAETKSGESASPRAWAERRLMTKSNCEVAYAKANPGKINMGSAGIGSTGHLAGELLQMMTGVKLTHVPYRGNAPALTDLIAGQVQLVFPSTASAIEYVKTGKLRGLASTGTARLDALPDLPTVADSVPGYEASSLYGIGVPRGTPAEVVDRLNKEVNAALADPKMRARLADLGGTPFGGSPADFGKLIADETEKWGKVVRAANIKAE